MSAEYRVTDQEVHETGSEPEYVANRLVRYEFLNDQTVRLYFASSRGKHLRMEFTTLVDCAELSVMARMCSDIAARLHNYAITLLAMNGKPN